MTAPDPTPLIPLVVRVQMRYEDVTPVLHIGNAAVLSLIEEARSRLMRFGAVDATGAAVPGLLDDGADGWPHLVVQQTIEYPVEMRYALEPVRIGFWVGRIGGSSFSLDAEIRYAEGDEVLVRTESVIVITDPDNAPIRIEGELRARLERYLGAPVELRPRQTAAPAGAAR